MIVPRGGLGSECKHGLKRRVCSTCRQQLRDRLFGSPPRAQRPAIRLPGDGRKRRPDIPAGLPGNGKKR
jgi:hypothetical protein